MVKYPVYVFSHKRADPNESSSTKYLKKNNIPYNIVVAPNEVNEYKKYHKNVIVGKKGQSPNMNSILDKHKNGDWVWLMDDDWGDISKSTYRNAMNTAEKYVHPKVGQIGFRHSNLWAHTLPPVSHNAMMYNFSLVQVSPVRYNKLNKFNNDFEFTIDNILQNDKINLKLNKFRVIQENKFQSHEGGRYKEYTAGMPQGLTPKQSKEYKDKVVEGYSVDSANRLKKKYNFKESAFEPRQNRDGGKWIFFNIDKMVPKYKNWKQLLK